MTKVLYLTYDGLLDPLGQSQIVPYIIGLTLYNYKFIIVSFEKKQNDRELQQRTLLLLESKGIRWISLAFTSRYGVFGKLLDLIKLFGSAAFMCTTNKVQILHTRSYPPSQIGLCLKLLFRIPLIFDMRGLWADERVEKGSWNLKSRTHRYQFYLYKSLEKKLLKNSDIVISLTQSSVPFLSAIGLKKERLLIIPCCADYRKFQLPTDDSITQARINFSIPADAFVLGFLGSVGKMYLLEKFFELFSELSIRKRNIFALAITNNPSELAHSAQVCLSESTLSNLRICNVMHSEVPSALQAISLLTAFCAPTFAKMAMSPTKIGEAVAMGIPVITNHGVGDAAACISQMNAGYVINICDSTAIRKVASNLSLEKINSGYKLRQLSRSWYDLENGVDMYANAYAKLRSN